MLLLLTKVLELPGQNVAALVSAKRGGGGMARSTEGAHRRGRTSLNMKLDFFYDTATTPQLCTVRLSGAAFSHIQRAILDNWNIELSSLNLKVNCMFLQHTAHTHTHTYTDIHTYIL